MNSAKKKINPYVFGIIGFISMSVLYYALLWFTTRDALHPLVFFTQKWFFLAPIFVGFGIQMMLFQKLRIAIQKIQLAMAGASAGMNGVAMAACCAHHIADIFPIVGFAGAAVFMTKYQDIFLAVGALMNFVGVWYMLARLKKQYVMHCVVHPVQN